MPILYWYLDVLSDEKNEKDVSHVEELPQDLGPVVFFLFTS